MKKRFFIVFTTFVFLVLTAAAQGTLQFNQVLLLSSMGNTNVNMGTVPAGKVWKITGMGTEAAGSSTSCGISFNGTNVAINLGTVYTYGTAYTLQQVADDIWLPAGTSVYGMACSYYRWVSVIEFNVIP